MNRIAGFAFSTLCVALAALSLYALSLEREGKKRADDFARKFTIDLRRSAALATAEVAPAADFRITPLADAALADAVGSVSLADLSPSMQRTWIENAARVPDELAATTDLLLKASAARPGWAFHRFLLGEVAYVSSKRAGPLAASNAGERWMLPLHGATSEAPGDDAIWGVLGDAYLESWDGLSPASRRDAEKVLERAFLNPGFVSRSYAAVRSALGPETSARFLPGHAPSLAAALYVTGRLGDTADVARLYERWEEAKHRERAEDFSRVEERAGFGDLQGLAGACRAFVAAHPPADLDDAAGRRMAARVVEVWPSLGAGTWRSDPRGELIRFFLDGRSREVDGVALAQLGAELSGTPEPVRARLALLAGDHYAYEQIMRKSQTLGSLEWTPFLTELCELELKAGRIQEAEQTLSTLARPARGECGVMLTRQKLLRAKGGHLAQKELEELRAALAAACPDSMGAEVWSEAGSLPICVDPARDDDRFLNVRVTTSVPTLLAFGWDGGRSGVILVTGESRISVPMKGLSGRRIFAVQPLAGPRPTALEATRGPKGVSGLASTNLPAAQAAPRSAAKVAGVAGSEKLNSTRP